MPPKTLILDPSHYDVNHVIAGIEEIRRYNRHRYEMEQLTAICYEDREQHICVGYKDVGADEFWVRGNIPGMPIMPGVIMCEAAAQLASYYGLKYKLLEADLIAFGGLQDVHFRGFVRPGNRLVIVLKALRARSFMLSCQFQGLVGNDLVCDGIIKGVPVVGEPS